MRAPSVLTGIFAVILIGTVQTQAPTASIRGRVVPWNAAVNVWAVSDADTAHGVIQNGEFNIRKLKAGHYRLIVEGRRPYKVTTRPNVVVVSDTSFVNVGDIMLDQ
ncbi:MAG: hypothetical protein JO301_11990 [Chitinophagaceae bacterium]|nr:hypothetical protein [Chitinophagaceae bacterium]